MHIVILITAKNSQQAEEISKHLVESRLAACVNIVPNIHSIFKWQDKVDSANEVLMIVKSRQSLFEKIEVTVKGIHSYSVPEIIALPMVAGNKDYLNWINESTEGN